MPEVGDLVSLPDYIPSTDGTGIVNSIGDGAKKHAIVSFNDLCWISIPVEKVAVIEKRPEMTSKTTKTCPKCGSKDLILDGWKVRKSGERMQRYKCRTCGRKSIHPTGNSPAQPRAAKIQRGAKVKAKAGQHRLNGPGLVLRTRADDGYLLVQFKSTEPGRTIWIHESECIPVEPEAPRMPLQASPQIQAAKFTS